MIKAIISRSLNSFTKKYDYDTAYMQEILAADPRAIIKLGLARTLFDYSRPLPPTTWHAARVRAVQSADCGPCLELAIKLAEENGVTHETVVSILKGKVAEPDLQLAVDFTDAVLANAPEHFDLVERARERFGIEGCNALSIAVVGGIFYPVYKRGLGYAKTCQPILAKMDIQ